ncbi:MAG: hypothetical protein CSB46_00400 [Micrococcales bacterium]|nr:MAG: hypothetical protein CSB46_00400 [Micrococcales bacterium]
MVGDPLIAGTGLPVPAESMAKMNCLAGMTYLISEISIHELTRQEWGVWRRRPMPGGADGTLLVSMSEMGESYCLE